MGELAPRRVIAMTRDCRLTETIATGSEHTNQCVEQDPVAPRLSCHRERRCKGSVSLGSGQRLGGRRRFPLAALVRAFLIGAHQARIARHIGGEDRGKTAGGSRDGRSSGGNDSRAEFNLLRARTRRFHAAPWWLRTGSAGHSSGIPALRSPASSVASNKARVLGDSDLHNPLVLIFAMLGK
jgi:hypothetical protein